MMVVRLEMTQSMIAREVCQEFAGGQIVVEKS
ncbi:hypothetical protein Pan216_39240 [Planctomycetes bacterium Pan216]|uniref:Uncharacterized protein n=1 Tax=Kolteria novifilia TaxID=2527975 RepID=A0A518B7U5_9BACT|nr:hypothetical protein Pan216_39240 [Planctomycetes bacterium Pan216]